MRSRPSIKDIARRAGVAPSTVSRALAGSTRVSVATRKRIEALAAEMDYTPSAAARSLVTGASQTLGIIVPGLSDPYIAAVMEGIESASAAAGYQHVIASTGGDPEQEVRAARMLAGYNPDGLIILSSRAGKAYIDLLPTLNVPVAFVNSAQIGDSVLSIATDNEHGGWLATRHLLDLGHERIAYLGGPARGRSQQARAAGYRRALHEAGLLFDPDLILPGDGSIQAGQEALDRILSRPEDMHPTAVFCYNDLCALGLLAQARRHGLHPPESLSVVGFDDIPLAAICAPPLTTIEQRTTELGQLAADSIFAALRQEPVADIRLRGELIIRASTSPPKN